MDEEQIKKIITTESKKGKGDGELDEDITEYICSMLFDVDYSSFSIDDFTEITSPILLDCECVEDEEEGNDISKQIANKVFGNKTDNNDNSNSNSSSGVATLLSAPINVAQISQNAIDQSTSALDWMKPSDQASLVNQQALEVQQNKKKRTEEKKLKRAQNKRRKELQKLGVDESLINQGLVRAEKSGGSKDVKIEGFNLSHGKLELLHATDLKLVYGRRYGLVGRNGAGKSTLLKAIAAKDLAIPTNLSYLLVEQEVAGDDTTAVDSVLNADVELMNLRQEEEHLLTNDPSSARLRRVYELMDEIDAHTAESRARSILSGLSFTQDMQDQPTKDFSGGWRMRIALARALFSKPDLLMLDEPTNHLDFHAVIWLEQFLNTWNSTLVVVSHQREFLNGIATDMIHLYQKQLMYYKGNYDEFERVASERLRNMKKTYESNQMQRKHIQKFIDKFRFNAKRASLVQSRIKKLEKMSEVSNVVEEGAVYLPFDSIPPINPPILQFVDVSFSYEKDGEPLFKDLNIGIDLESRVALVGPNGAGKTTLLKLFAGELEASSGIVERNRKLRFATFSQHFVDQLDLNCSPLEYFAKKYTSMTSLEVRNHLGRYGISGDLALRTMNVLSGGQKSRVVFAEMAKTKPHVLLLDEPSNHLDIETIEGLAQSLTAFEGGLLMVSHDQRLIQLVCDEIWQVTEGTVKKWNGSLNQYKKYLESQNLTG